MGARGPFAKLARVLLVGGAAIVAVGSFPSVTEGLVTEAHAAPRKAKRRNAGKDFAYTVSDCHGAGELPSIRLEVSDGAVAFNQVLTLNCIAATRPGTVKVAYAKKGRDLEISVVLRSEVLSDCTCPIGIDGRIANLGTGSYRISFVYDGPTGTSAGEPPVRRTVGSDELSLK